MATNDVSYKCLEEYSVVLTSGFMKDYTNAHSASTWALTNDDFLLSVSAASSTFGGFFLIPCDGVFQALPRPKWYKE